MLIYMSNKLQVYAGIQLVDMELRRDPSSRTT